MKTLADTKKALLKSSFLLIAFLTTEVLFAQETQANGNTDGGGGYMGNGITWMMGLAILLIIVVVISKMRKKNV